MQRKHQICIHCRNYVPETDNMEGECNVDEDIDNEEYCESYEWNGGKR